MSPFALPLLVVFVTRLLRSAALYLQIDLKQTLTFIQRRQNSLPPTSSTRSSSSSSEVSSLAAQFVAGVFSKGAGGAHSKVRVRPAAVGGEKDRLTTM